MKKILVINPGSTSTKVALYEDDKKVWEKSAHHNVEELSHYNHFMEQYPIRLAVVRSMLAEDNIPLHFDAVIGRGGLLKPTPGGVYEVTPLIKHDLIHAKMEHVCNLGALIAADIAADAKCKAFIADPEVVNEFIPESRYTGIPDIHRRSIFHALNTKAVARKYAKERNTRYEDLNLIMVHLGGGISVGAHRKGKVIDVNNALNGDGPISPERAGTLPSLQLAEMCYSGKYTLPQIKKLICGCGGMAAHLGVTDMRQVMPQAEAGEQPYAEVVSAMAYTIAKEIGSRAVALQGNVDAIIYTGGIAYNKYFTDLISSWVKWIGPIVLMPGEDEMESLASNALGALNGTLPMQTYAPNDADD